MFMDSFIFTLATKLLSALQAKIPRQMSESLLVQTSYILWESYSGNGM